MIVQPLPGHAICNVGDALNIFSGGVIRSNIHRVVSAISPDLLTNRAVNSHMTRVALLPRTRRSTNAGL